MDNTSYLQKVRDKRASKQESNVEKTPDCKDKGKWLYTSDHMLAYDINGVILLENDIPDTLREEFKSKDKYFSGHLKSFYDNLNRKNLSPDISEDFETFFMTNCDEILRDQNYTKYNEYVLAKLAKKHNIRPNEHFYVYICNKELNKKNPYPNCELIENICKDFNDEKFNFNMHAAKHLFDKECSLLDREETLPFAVQVFERAAQAYIRGDDGDVLANFDVVLDYYLKYKVMMMEKGISVEDSESMQNPKVQERVEYLKKTGPENFMKDLLRRQRAHNPEDPVYLVRGHFVDVDGTLIQKGKLNKKLYEDMLKAIEVGEPVYIFSGERKEVQTARLEALGVDMSIFPFINKSELKNCIICGTIVDDTPPYLQGFCGWVTLQPNQDSYEFHVKGGRTTVPELLALRRGTNNDTQTIYNGR
ncbi:MAG: hypothetical protein J5895_02940 [Alphaproteobacteria bacterium]|nr:hypothetical protein [Alphaproteobacteria bacterium]